MQGLHTAVLLLFPFRSCVEDLFSSPTCEVVTDRSRGMRKARRGIAWTFKKVRSASQRRPDCMATANAWLADKTLEDSPERATLSLDARLPRIAKATSTSPSVVPMSLANLVADGRRTSSIVSCPMASSAVQTKL